MSNRRFLLSSCAAALFAAVGCTEAMYQPFDAGQAGSGGGSAGRGGSAGGGASGSGVAGGGVAGMGGGGSGVAGMGGGGSGGLSGSGGAGGTAGAAGRGGTGGAAGRGGAGGTGAMAGMGGSAGRVAARAWAAARARVAAAWAAARAWAAAPVAAVMRAAPWQGWAVVASAASVARLAVIPTMAGQLVVTELMHDAVVVNNDDFGEWFELHNPDPTVTFDLFGCTLRDAANPHVIVTHFLMPPRSFKTFAISANPGFTPDYIYSEHQVRQSGGRPASTSSAARRVIDTYSYPDSVGLVGGRSFAVDPTTTTPPKTTRRRTGACAMMPTTRTDLRPNYGTPGGPTRSARSYRGTLCVL